MRFLVTGATGLIGRKIVDIILNRGHKLNILTTNRKLIDIKSNLNYYYWNPEDEIIDEKCIFGVDVVINLAGSPIAQFWTKKAKKSILFSRIKSVKLLEKLILKKKTIKIKQFVCASAIGIYPSNTNNKFDENSNEISNTFLGNTVKKWEESCDVIESSDIKLLKLRIGLVLSNNDGFLKPISLAIKYYLGVWFGNGKNYYSWIHIDDIAESIIYLIDNDKEGTYNLVSPNPVISKVFVYEIARILKTKILFPSIPKKIVHLFSGEMSELLIFNQNVSSNKLVSDGFKFKYPDLKSALENLLK